MTTTSGNIPATVTPFTAERTRHGTSRHKSDKVRLMPAALRVSLATQFATLAAVSFILFLSGRLLLAAAAVMATLAVVLVSRLLSGGGYHIWQGTRRCAYVGVLVFAVLTMCVSIWSPWHGAIGIIAVLLQIQYLIALSSRRAITFFSIGRPAAARITHSSARNRIRRWVAVLVAVLTYSMTGGSAMYSDSAAWADEEESRLPLKDLLQKIPEPFASSRDATLRLLKRYEQQRFSQQEAAMSELQKRLATARRINGPTSNQAVAVESTIKWLTGQGAPPNDAAAMAWVVSYADQLVRKRGGFERQLSGLLTRLSRAGHFDEAMTLQGAFHRLETGRSDDEPLVDQRRFKGYRTTTDGKKLISLRFTVDDGTDSQFSGSVERDFMYSGHPVHDLTGVVQGLNVKMQTGSLRVFGNRADNTWSYSGVILGRSIIGRYAGRDKKGKPVGGLFHVRTGK